MLLVYMFVKNEMTSLKNEVQVIYIPCDYFPRLQTKDLTCVSY